MVIGYMTFKEELSFRWYFGSFLMIVGVVLLAKAKEESDEDLGVIPHKDEKKLSEGPTRLSDVRIPIESEKGLNE